MARGTSQRRQISAEGKRVECLIANIPVEAWKSGTVNDQAGLELDTALPGLHGRTLYIPHDDRDFRTFSRC
jgi:hypothetical protein